jgi:hypothetical protein
MTVTTSPTPAEHTALPDTLAGHWATPEGALKAREYAALDRGDLVMGDMSDFSLANAQFLQMRDSLLLGQYQTAAKERIRWLSAKLAIAEAAVNERPMLLSRIRELEEKLSAARDYGWAMGMAEAADHVQHSVPDSSTDMATWGAINSFRDWLVFRLDGLGKTGPAMDAENLLAQSLARAALQPEQETA